MSLNAFYIFYELFSSGVSKIFTHISSRSQWSFDSLPTIGVESNDCSVSNLIGSNLYTMVHHHELTFTWSFDIESFLVSNNSSELIFITFGMGDLSLSLNSSVIQHDCDAKFSSVSEVYVDASDWSEQTDWVVFSSKSRLYYSDLW